MRVPRFTPWLLVATLVAAGAAAALGYGLTAPKRYRATAQLLVAPVAADDATFAGLDVLRDATGKRTAAASAAVLVRSPQVVDAVRTQLGVRRSRASLLGDVDAHVVGSSDVVDVSVEDTSPTTAAQLANAFVDALVAQRTTTFQSQLASAIRRDTQLLAGGAGAQTVELARRLAELRSFQGQPDPTLRRASTATPPASASWPRVWALVLAGAGIGLAIGAVAWLALALARRDVRRGGSDYSPGMSDRAVESLVDRLEQRLAGRESALAARGRDLQAKIDELRALEAARAQAPDLSERERALEERVAAVTKRELEVARLAAGGAPRVDDPALAERERALEERIAAVTEREEALAERVALVTERELATARAAAQPVSRPVAAPAPPAEVAGAFNLGELERLVAAHGAEHPDRHDEWDSTLFFLRDYAAPDGTLPGSFDWLVQDTFSLLLD